MLVAVDAPHFYAGIVLDGDTVVAAAPILKWTIGKRPRIVARILSAEELESNGGEMSGKFDGIYQNVPNGLVHAFLKHGWELLPHVYQGTHHSYNGQMMKWPGDEPPEFPPDWKRVA
jgi:hypothetical protein